MDTTSQTEVPPRVNCVRCHLVRIGTFTFIEPSDNSVNPQYMELYLDKVDIWLYPGVQISILKENIKKVWQYIGRGVPKAFICILVDAESSRRILKCLQAKFRNTTHFRTAVYDSASTEISHKFISVFPVDFSMPILKDYIEEIPFLKRGARLSMEQVREFVLCISGGFQKELSFRLYLPKDMDEVKPKTEPKTMGSVRKRLIKNSGSNSEKKSKTLGDEDDIHPVEDNDKSEHSTDAVIETTETVNSAEFPINLVRVTTKVTREQKPEGQKIPSPIACISLSHSSAGACISIPHSSLGTTTCISLPRSRSLLKASSRSVLRQPGIPCIEQASQNKRQAGSSTDSQKPDALNDDWGGRAHYILLDNNKKRSLHHPTKRKTIYIVKTLDSSRTNYLEKFDSPISEDSPTLMSVSDQSTAHNDGKRRVNSSDNGEPVVHQAAGCPAAVGLVESNDSQAVVNLSEDFQVDTNPSDESQSFVESSHDSQSVPNDDLQDDVSFSDGSKAVITLGSCSQTAYSFCDNSSAVAICGQNSQAVMMLNNDAQGLFNPIDSSQATDSTCFQAVEAHYDSQTVVNSSDESQFTNGQFVLSDGEEVPFVPDTSEPCPPSTERTHLIPVCKEDNQSTDMYNMIDHSEGGPRDYGHHQSGGGEVVHCDVSGGEYPSECVYLSDLNKEFSVEVEI